MRNRKIDTLAVSTLIFGLIGVAQMDKSADAAEALQLRPGVVFNQDTDNGFPIIGKNLNDAKIEKGKPTLIFFGASGDLNTNRQAKRLVEIYNKTSSKSLKFILVDVDHPATSEGKALIKTYYRGYIPFEVLLAHDGKESWSQTGEVQNNLLRKKIEAVLIPVAAEITRKESDVPATLSTIHQEE